MNQTKKKMTLSEWIGVGQRTDSMGDREKNRMETKKDRKFRFKDQSNEKKWDIAASPEIEMINK